MSFALDIRTVRGVSMLPSIKDGEPIVIFKQAYGLNLPFVRKPLISWAAPKKNDVVAFYIDSRMVIKRVYLTGGESIAHTEILGEKYIIAGNTQLAVTAEEFRTLCGNGVNARVPENMFLALGDNFSLSEDSRLYGFVSYESIIGKVLCK